MAAKGKNWFDVLKWVEKVIESCETSGQERTTRKLVKLYFERYKKEFGEVDLHIYNMLMEKLDNIKYEKI